MRKLHCLLTFKYVCQNIKKTLLLLVIMYREVKNSTADIYIV